MSGPVFAALSQEAAYKREAQLNKYNYTYHVNAVVANNTTLAQYLTIDQDADFDIQQITGSCYGPCTSAGVPSLATATIFPQPGTTVGFAGRGLSMRITDMGTGRDLTSGFVPLELILTPGYDVGMQKPFQFKYWAKRNSKLRFDFRNRDTTASFYHNVDIAINGNKYMGFENAQPVEATNASR